VREARSIQDFLLPAFARLALAFVVNVDLTPMAMSSLSSLASGASL